MEADDDGAAQHDDNQEIDDAGLKLEDTRDEGNGLPKPYQGHKEQADAAVLATSVEARSAIVLHLEFGDSIETEPGVSRFVRICVPPLADVAYARRAVSRQLCPGLYPSFLRLSKPDSGEVLGSGSLLSNGVHNDDVLRLDVVEGDVFEALRVEVQEPPPPLETATRRRHQQEQQQRQQAAAAAAAAAAGGAAGELQGRKRKQQQQEPRPLSPGSGRSKRPFSREETFALLDGIIKHGFKSWKKILEDPRFADTFQGRTEVNLKDRWRNLERAAERGFKDMGRGFGQDTELHGKVLQVAELR